MPITAKRQKHLDRQAKKNKMLRTKVERREKIDEVLDNFSRTRYTTVPEFESFFKLCNAWVEDGVLRQGIIPVPIYNIEICYTLNNSKLHDVGVMIKQLNNTNNTSTTTSQIQPNSTNSNNTITDDTLDAESDEPPELVNV
jgi:hypothetical protein